MTAKILVVDDTDTLRTMMTEILENADLDIEIVEATDGSEALPIALSGNIDIVLSDIVMPNLDGIGLLRAIRKEHDTASLPVILVTSQAPEETRGLSFEVGASDYLTRPFSPAELVTRIQVQLRLKALQKELQRGSERHRRLSTLDDLTGLANRSQFLELCRREMARTRRHELSMSVCVLDIDNLHDVNTRLGVRAGDALINGLATLVRRHMRTDDTLARFTGGTFAMLLPHTDLDQARTAARRVASAIADGAFPGHEAGEITISAGTATYPVGDLETIEELINGAQASLDRAKGRGGNRVDEWQPEEPSRAER